MYENRCTMYAPQQINYQSFVENKISVYLNSPTYDVCYKKF
jgi:hypothetical protein